MSQGKRFYLRGADIRKAARYIYNDASLTARPVSWRNTGYGLVAHGGFLYRVHGNEEMNPYQLPVIEMMEPWEVVKRFQLQEEIDGTFKAQRDKRPKFSRPDGTRKSGRPSKQEVSALFQGMLPIDDAAAQAGIRNYTLRRAILANKLPWLKKHGLYLVTMEDVLKWLNGPMGPRKKKNVDEQAIQYY